jgi:hypothetical protein
MTHLLMLPSLRRIARYSGLVMFLSALPLTIGPALAQSRDLAGATCTDFMRLQPDDQRAMAVWLSGFYAGTAQRPSIDGAALRDAHGALTKLCGEKMDTPLLGEATRDAIKSKS